MKRTLFDLRDMRFFNGLIEKCALYDLSLVKGTFTGSTVDIEAKLVDFSFERMDGCFS